jgi:hypothetical protein
MKPFLTLVLSALMLTACGHVARPYAASSDNASALGASDIAPVAVGMFQSTPPGLKSISCRVGSSVSAEPDYATYVRAALIDELQRGGRFDASSSRVLSGHLDLADFNSSILNGKWQLTLTLKNARGESLTVAHTHPFTGNYVADFACEKSAQELAPAVQGLIAATVKNPQFRALAKWPKPAPA